MPPEHFGTLMTTFFLSDDYLGLISRIKKVADLFYHVMPFRLKAFKALLNKLDVPSIFWTMIKTRQKNELIS